MFQKCPICNGTGSKAECTPHIPCVQCKGKKIINTETGFPPRWETQEEYDKEVGDLWVKMFCDDETKKIIEDDGVNLFKESIEKSKACGEADLHRENAMNENLNKPKKKSRFQQRLEAMAKQRGYKLPEEK